MSMSYGNGGDSPEEATGRVQPDTPERKPYLKPAFRYERVFETMALSCGKVNTTQLQCGFNRKNS